MGWRATGDSMQLSNYRDIAASPDMVWSALLNPAVLMACIPGCESMTGTPASGYQVVVVQKVGPVSARFNGIIHLSDITEGQAVTISGEGKGGAAGFAKGGARVTLAAEGHGTRLSYTVEANVGGKIARLGSRIIDGFARKLADQFFENFKSALEQPAGADTADIAAADAQTTRTGWFRRIIGG